MDGNGGSFDKEWEGFFERGENLDFLFKKNDKSRSNPYGANVSEKIILNKKIKMVQAVLDEEKEKQKMLKMQEKKSKKLLKLKGLTMFLILV